MPNLIYSKLAWFQGFKKSVFKTDSFVLAPTAEALSVLINVECGQFKIYQINSKFRKEIRPKLGLIRTYEFVMKDCYLLLSSKLDLLTFLKNALISYMALFSRWNVLGFLCLACAGTFGGKHSFEFLSRACGDTLCFVHKHTLFLKFKSVAQNYINFTAEYACESKIVLDLNYLKVSCIELVHVFMFGQLECNRLWFASIGVGVTRLLGVFCLCWDVFKWVFSFYKVVVVSTLSFRIKSLCAYSRYVCLVFKTLKVSCSYLNIHTSRALGRAKWLGVPFVLFINIFKFGFCFEVSFERSNMRRVLSLVRFLTFVN